MSKADLDDSFNAPPVPVENLFPTRDEILDSLRWRKPEEIVTGKGPRVRTVARASNQAIQLFQSEGTELYKLGYTLSQWPKETGPWLVTRWELVPVKVVVQRSESREMSHATTAKIDIPRPSGMEFFPFQKAGVAFGITRPHCLIADEPGLGKTCQSLGIVNCDPTARRVLIVCPASLKLNWLKECRMWLARKRTIFVADSKVFPELADGVIIINYDVLIKHRDAIRDTEWDVIICDEAHMLKNPKAKRTELLFGVIANREEKKYGMADIPPIHAKRRILLTGTPIANRPKELYPLINFLDPIEWSSKWKYQTRYCGACQENGWNADGASNLSELQDRLRRSIMIRRLKIDVMKELPPKTRRVVEFAPTGEMKDLILEERSFFATEKDYKAAIENATLKPIIGDRPTYRKNCAVAKANMPEVLSYLDNAVEESGKLIIFVWHREVYALLRARFGHSAVGMNGDTPQTERQAAVDAFQNSPAISVIIGQIITMGTGHTLTASSRVVMFELDDVPGNVTQCEDRAHRIGQKDNVLVEHIIITGTIDSRMALNCINKQEIIDKALDAQSKAAASKSQP